MISPFDKSLEIALAKTGIKSWLMFCKVWLMKSLWNFSGRKFQALVMSIIVCLIFQADVWIIIACLGGYGGINLMEKHKIK